MEPTQGGGGGARERPRVNEGRLLQNERAHFRRSFPREMTTGGFFARSWMINTGGSCHGLVRRHGFAVCCSLSLSQPAVCLSVSLDVVVVVVVILLLRFWSCILDLPSRSFPAPAAPPPPPPPPKKTTIPARKEFRRADVQIRAQSVVRPKKERESKIPKRGGKRQTATQPVSRPLGRDT